MEMVLEAPPSAESPTTLLGSGSLLETESDLLGDDTVVITAAKFALVESFLRQLTRDQSFPDFHPQDFFFR